VELKEEIETLASETDTPIAPDNAIGRLTRMEAIESQSVFETTLGFAKERLTKLESALENIDEDYFGFCKECTEAIPMKRLMLVPETNLCIECAQKQEHH